MQKYHLKRHGYVEAEQWRGPGYVTTIPVGAYAEGEGRTTRAVYYVMSEEGTGGFRLELSPNDWIVKDMQGHITICKPDVFAATYEPIAS